MARRIEANSSNSFSIQNDSRLWKYSTNTTIIKSSKRKKLPNIIISKYMPAIEEKNLGNCAYNWVIEFFNMIKYPRNFSLACQHFQKKR